MSRKYLLPLLCLILCASPVLAQERYDFSRFKDESFDFIKQPGHWRGGDWLRVGLTTAGVFILMQVDQPVRGAYQGHQKYYYSVPIEGGRRWAEWYTPPLIAGSFAAYGWLAHNHDSRGIAFELVQAVLYSESITQVLKICTGRARPYTNKGAFTFHPFSFNDKPFNALPAGHTANAFAMSTVLSMRARSGALKTLAYLPSALTLVSRVYQDQHWTSDVFLGAAIGCFVGKWVVGLHGKTGSPVEVSAVNPFTLSIAF